MEDEKILIDRQTLKSIASDTRMNILKHLSSRKYTLSKLSKKLSLKDPTVKEHLDHLISSGLVKREDSENKWKYYSLTEKGEKLIKPKEVKVLITFVISLFATLGLIGLYIFNFFKGKSFSSMDASMVMETMVANDMLESVSSTEIVSDASIRSAEVLTTFPEKSFNKEIILIIGIFFLLCLTIFLFILYIKQKKEDRKKCVKIIE